MKRAAVYARYSSELQSPTSTEDQIKLCERYAEHHGWVVVDCYRDDAISGAASVNRPGYQQLVRAALATPRAFDVVLVECLDRLHRSEETTTLYRRLRLRGIAIVGVSDGVDTSRKGATLQVGFSALKNAIFLDDVSEKTHRGLAGRVERGLTAGGRCFGYRVIDGRREIVEAEAIFVRRVWSEYAAGRSFRRIATQLNVDGVPFPSMATKRGPARKGWAGSTIRVILMNELYSGRAIWNRSQFLKDPDTGRRRRVARPPAEWHDAQRPELRIIPPDLEQNVAARLAAVRDAYGSRARVHDGRWIPTGRAPIVYPRHLLSGMLRCAACGAAMVAHTTTRRKGDRVYRRTWFHCAAATDKGPAVCCHDVGYRLDHLEGALVARFREATANPDTIERLVELVNAHVAVGVQGRGARAEALAAEIARLEHETKNLVRFVAQGGDGPSVQAELRQLDGELARRRAELTVLEAARRAAPAQAHPTWIRKRLDQLDKLLARDPVRARIEIQKHLDGVGRLRPLPAPAGQRAAEIIWRVKPDSLLAVDQEAVCRVQMVAGVGFEPTTFGL